MKHNRLKANSFLARNSARLLALAGMSLSAPSLFAATGIWTGVGGDGFWDITANTEWTGVTGNAWDATNGPNNVAQFNSGVNANIGTSGTPVVNGIIWNGVNGVISFGGVKLDGTNPFVSVSSGFNALLFASLTGTNGFTKTGAGTVNLDGGGGVKGITGGFTVSQGGLRLTLGGSPNVANSSNTLNLAGSNLEVFGNGTQTLSTFTLGNRGSRIVITPNGAANSTTLSLADWTRASSNSSIVIDLSAANGTAKTVNLTGTLPSLTNSIIGGYATVRDSTTTYGFATLDGSNNVVRYTGATPVGAALDADTVSTTNYQATAGGTLFDGSSTTQSLNSLDIAVARTDGGTTTISGTSGATYVPGSGGLLFSGNSTNGNVVANMTFTSATSELQIATVQYNNGFAVPIVGGVTDNGGTSVSLIKAGTGGLSMGTGTFSYTGDTIVNDGILHNIANIPSGAGKGNLVVNSRGIVAIGLGNSGGTRTINGLSNTTLGGGTVNNQTFSTTAAATSFLDLGNNDGSATFSGVITGAFGIIKSGTGTQTLSGANTYTGTTTISAGTLQLGDTGATGSLSPSSTIVNNGTFTVARNNAVSQGTHFSGAPITGTGGFTQFGAGTTTLNAANTYTGLTAINAGTLVVAGGSAIIDTGAVFIDNAANATLQLDASETIGSLNGGGLTGGTVALGTNTLTVGDATSTTYSGAITGAAGTLVKQGTGALTLDGSQTYGTLTANDGTTNVKSLLGTGASTVNANAIVNFTTSQTLAALNIGNGAVVTLTGSAGFAPEGMAPQSLTVATVPEPGSVSLLLVGVLGLLGYRRRSARMA